MKNFLLSIIFFTFYCNAADFHIILNQESISFSNDSLNVSNECNDWFNELFNEPSALHHSLPESNLPKKNDQVIHQEHIDVTITAILKSQKPLKIHYRKDKCLPQDHLLFYSKLNINNLSKEERENDSKEQYETRMRLSKDKDFQDYCESLHRKSLHRKSKK